MLERAERASHIDPPASSYAIMQRASPYCGENPGPGKDVRGELEPRPGIRERASHIDPPASSYAIMQRASPYCGENPGPGKDVRGELEPRPGIREQPGSIASDRHARHARAMSAFTPIASKHWKRSETTRCADFVAKVTAEKL